jgi:hypothetical protein
MVYGPAQPADNPFGWVVPINIETMFLYTLLIYVKNI